MVDYVKHLNELDAKCRQLVERRHKLQEEMQHIIEKRKIAAGKLLEHFGLLKQSDELLCGLFAEAEAAIKNQSEKVKQWELAGQAFIKPKKPTESKEPVPAETSV